VWSIVDPEHPDQQWSIWISVLMAKIDAWSI
jgi:hypothetical protein